MTEAEQYRLYPNAAYRLYKNTIAQETGSRRTFPEWLACGIGRHKWFLDGGSVEQPRYASDEPRWFCGRAYCEARRGDWTDES